MSEDSYYDGVSSDCPPSPTPEDQGSEARAPANPATFDNIALFYAFAREKFPTLNKASIPCAQMHRCFQTRDLTRGCDALAAMVLPNGSRVLLPTANKSIVIKQRV
eukprot:gene3043-13063_t